MILFGAAVELSAGGPSWGYCVVGAETLGVIEPFVFELCFLVH